MTLFQFYQVVRDSHREIIVHVYRIVILLFLSIVYRKSRVNHKVSNILFLVNELQLISRNIYPSTSKSNFPVHKL